MKANKLNLGVLLFYVTCILSTVDTSLFVNASLSKALFLELGILLMSILALYSMLKQRIAIVTSKYDFFLLTWIIYVLFHFAVSQPHELYRTLYLVITLSMVLVTKSILKIGLVGQNVIINGLIFIALIQVFFIMLQFLGITDSGNPYFKIVGATENPTVAAIYFVGVLPLLQSRIKCNKLGIFYIFLLLLLLLCIYLLKCRTAYIGCLVVALVYTIMLKGRSVFGILDNVKKWVVVLGFVSFVIFAGGMKLYELKKDSADGRILIWKLSTELIAENPWGYGYGLFEKNYNLKQADYFRAKKYSDAELRNASFIYMPYNDFLEHGVEGGVVGGMFLLLFYVVMIVMALKRKQCVASAIFISFGVMSMTNFVYGAILPWLLLMCMAGFVMVNEDKKNIDSQLDKSILQCVPMLGLVLFLTYLICKLTSAQIELKSLCGLNNQVEVANDNFYAGLKSKISTSEIYWKQRASNNIKIQQYLRAISNIHEARKFSSSPELFMQEAICLSCMGYKNRSMKYIDTLSMMVPRKLSYKRILMRYYLSRGMHERASYYAREILVVGTKKNTPKASIIINEAKKCLKRYEK